MPLLFATTHPGKLAELRALLGPGREVLSLADVGPFPEVEEDGDTFAANAEKKARAYGEAAGLPALADDSGLCVDALGGRPGVLSARYGADDAGRIARLLGELEGVPDERRSAAFECALCLWLPGGELWRTDGRCEGSIATQPRGTGGFGYDAVFLVPELGRTYAELSREEKTQRSHRGRAFAAMRPLLAKAFSEGRPRGG